MYKELMPIACLILLVTSSMHNMFGASVSEVYNIIWCQFDLKIDNLTLMIGKTRMVV